LIEIGSKTAEKNSAQTNRQTDIHYENNGHLAVNQKSMLTVYLMEYDFLSDIWCSINGQTMHMRNHFWATVTSNGSPYATGPLSRLSCL